MRRVAVIVAVWVVVLAAVATRWLAVNDLAPPDPEEEAIIADVPRHDAGSPLVVWLGDSTIRPTGVLTYPELIAGAFLKPAHVENVVRTGLGFTFAQYYCLLGPIVAARPSVVVFVLHLRRMREVVPSSARLCSRLSSRAIVNAANLPFAQRGLSFAQMLSAQLLRWPGVYRTARHFTALRTAALTVWLRYLLGEPPAITPPHGPRSTQLFVDQWRQNSTEHGGSMRLLAANVREARASGAQVVVVVNPVPIRALVEAGVWDAAKYEHLIGRYRTVVEESGGTLIDLHDLLPNDGFRGTPGFAPIDSHPDNVGALRIADRLGPVIVRKVEEATGRRLATAPPSH